MQRPSANHTHRCFPRFHGELSLPPDIACTLSIYRFWVQDFMTHPQAPTLRPPSCVPRFRWTISPPPDIDRTRFNLQILGEVVSLGEVLPLPERWYLSLTWGAFAVACFGVYAFNAHILGAGFHDTPSSTHIASTVRPPPPHTAATHVALSCNATQAALHLLPPARAV